MEEEAEAEEPVLLKPVARGREESEKDGEDDEDGTENESWRDNFSFLVFTKCFDLSKA